MPIYAYRCSDCGHAKDVLQKMSDPVLTVCPACGASTFVKQVTAAGFQLKGSGWYVTDFKGGGAAPAATDSGNADAQKAGAGNDAAEKGAAEKGDASKSDAAKPDTPSAPKATAPVAAPAAVPAPAPPPAGAAPAAGVK